MKSRIKTRHFTLIEMIAVVALAGILIGLFAPAFTRMMFGSKVDQAASNFKLGLEMAQAKAIASRKYVAMVIPLSPGDAKPRLRKYALGGYRLAYVKKDGTKFKFSGWVPGSSWRNADDGARLVHIDSGDSFKDLPDNGSDELDSSKLLFEVAAGDEDATKLTGNDYELLKMDDLGSGSDMDGDISELGKDNNRLAIIFSPLGGIANDTTESMRFYFTETKVSADGTSIEYPNPDNVIELCLKPITGRVEYL